VASVALQQQRRPAEPAGVSVIKEEARLREVQLNELLLVVGAHNCLNLKESLLHFLHFVPEVISFYSQATSFASVNAPFVSHTLQLLLGFVQVGSQLFLAGALSALLDLAYEAFDLALKVKFTPRLDHLLLLDRKEGGVKTVLGSYLCEQLQHFLLEVGFILLVSLLIVQICRDLGLLAAADVLFVFIRADVEVHL